MKKINISITKAQLHGFAVTMTDGAPEVTATIYLYGENGTKITEYTIATNHWESNLKFELPLGMHAPILSMIRELESVVVEHCNNAQRLIGEMV